MFGNFLYFIGALLIYATCPIPETAPFTLPVSLLLFLLKGGLFYGLCRQRFGALYLIQDLKPNLQIDRQFDQTLRNLSILALLSFTTDLYGLSLTAFTSHQPPFKSWPSLEALLFLSIYIAYMGILWAQAHTAQKRIDHRTISQWAYVSGQIRFNLPLLIPWLILSFLIDLISQTAFEPLDRWVSSIWGELIFFTLFLLLAAILAPLLIRYLWGCIPLEPGGARDQIENLCRQSKLNYAEILRWPLLGGQMITAGVMGLAGRFRYLLVTDGLLKLLTPVEVDAVIAHEIGHVKKYHLVYYFLFLVGYMVLAWALVDLLQLVIISTLPVLTISQKLGFTPQKTALWLFNVLNIGLFLIYFRFLFGYFMRNFERQADAFAFTLAQTARPLVTTFKKISLYSGQDPNKPNWHHYSINERIHFLLDCETIPDTAPRHHRKVNRMLALYFAALILTGVAGWQLHFGANGAKLTMRLQETALAREVARQPNNPDLHGDLGDLYFFAKKYDLSVEAYEKALTIEPAHAEVLNNLAWLLITCEDPNWRNPQRALTLARRAAEQKPVAHILDTLAEAHFANGHIEEAIRIGRMALDRARVNKPYFKTQLEKFLKGKSENPVDN